MLLCVVKKQSDTFFFFFFLIKGGYVVAVRWKRNVCLVNLQWGSILSPELKETDT